MPAKHWHAWWLAAAGLAAACVVPEMAADRSRQSTSEGGYAGMPSAGAGTSGAAGSRAGEGGEAANGAGAACGPGQAWCDGACVQTDSNPNHCGKCHNVCAMGAGCLKGQCECPASQTVCNDECVDLTGDESNCGGCGDSCDSGEQCESGRCSCLDALQDCDGACVDLDSDGAHCGSCDTACPEGQVCSEGTCSDTCKTGLTQCGNSCVDLLRSVQTCGDCDTACPSGQSCVNGTCSCSEGEMLCGGQCVDVSADATNCGKCDTVCATGQSCVGGRCSCPSGQSSCDDACTDMLTDSSNCGACGVVCAAGQTCSAGRCVDTGAGGTSSAGGAGTGGESVGGVGTSGAGSGGVATGGVGTGGPAAGGTATGGAGTGGVAGGVATGGVGTGGTAAGGATTGGAGTGGVATGGADTGGAGTGGEPPVSETTLVVSGEGDYWQQGQLTETTGSPTITVDESTTYQNWIGFGGTFNEAGWDALLVLNAADRDRAIRLLFDKMDGCGFTFGRIPIGSSDYGVSRYSLDETAGDHEMSNFSIARDQDYLIPYIEAALAVKPDIRFWASPWSPPTWMKVGPFYDTTSSAFDGGSMMTDADTLNAHALYLARFVEEYAAEGIDIEAVCPQNDPGYAQGYPSCQWTATLFAEYIANYLGPLFAERLPSTEIWLGAMSNPTSDGIVTTVMSNTTAAGYISAIGLQWGMNTYVAQYVSDYDVPVMQTEHQGGNYPWVTEYQQTAPNDHAYAVESWELITSWIEAGVNSYSAWNMVLDTVGLSLDELRPWAQNALLTVNTSSGTLNVTPAYYVFRHCAAFVDPGSVRVATSGGDALAFQNPDGSIVTIMYNSGATASQTTLAVGTSLLQFSIPANGWATVDWQP